MLKNYVGSETLYVVEHPVNKVTSPHAHHHDLALLKFLSGVPDAQTAKTSAHASVKNFYETTTSKNFAETPQSFYNDKAKLFATIR